MGHNTKTSNRGVAIQKNTERVKELRNEMKEKLTALDKRCDLQRNKMIVLGDRLDALEQYADVIDAALIALDKRATTAEMNDRSLWGKVRDYVGSGWRFNFEKLTGKHQEFVVVEEEEDDVIRIHLDEDEEGDD